MLRRYSLLDICSQQKVNFTHRWLANFIDYQQGVGKYIAPHHLVKSPLTLRNREL